MEIAFTVAFQKMKIRTCLKMSRSRVKSQKVLWNRMMFHPAEKIKTWMRTVNHLDWWTKVRKPRRGSDWTRSTTPRSNSSTKSSRRTRIGARVRFLNLPRSSAVPSTRKSTSGSGIAKRDSRAVNLSCVNYHSEIELRMSRWGLRCTGVIKPQRFLFKSSESFWHL